MKAAWVAGPRQAAAFTNCEDRELSTKTFSITATGSKVEVIHNPDRGEPAGLCVVFEINGADRCFQRPLDEEGTKRLIPPKAPLPVTAVNGDALFQLACPPLRPYSVDLKLVSLDGKSLQPSVLRDLTGYPKLFSRDLERGGDSSWSMRFDKSELEAL